MQVLIDNEVFECDASGYIFNKKKQPIAQHRTIKKYFNVQQNTKVITSGHVYVLNYNKQTYKAKAPKDFAEYEKMKTKGLF